MSIRSWKACGRCCVNARAAIRRAEAQACASVPDLESESLHAIGSFFDRYDVRHFAYEIPCLMD